MSACADCWGEIVDRHLADADEGWQQDAAEWARTDCATDELRHNLEWMNVLHWMQYPKLYKEGWNQDG